MSESTKITAKELAALCGVDAKSMRRFVRMLAASPDAIASACGQGNRYGFTPSEAQAIRAAHAAHVASGGRRNVEARSLDALEALLADEAGDEIDA